MTVCASCNAEIPEGARFCRICGEASPAPIPVDVVGPAVADAWEVDRPRDAVGQTMLRIVGLFATVGGGLGAATMLFLFAIGFFSASDAESLEDIGQAFVGVIAIAAVLIFALLIGVVLAAVSGMYAARRAADVASAVRAGGMGSAAGHVALVVVLGIFLLSGVALFDATSSQPATPTPTPRTAEEIAECIELFGVDSPLCAGDQPADAAEEPDDPSDIGIDDLLKLALGVIPAGIVGATVAAIMFERRREESA